MSAYAYSVKVRSHRWSNRRRWEWACPICHPDGHPVRMSVTRVRAHREATHHAATCEALHWANLAAACPSCRRYGRVAPACPVCLGRGHIVEREGLT